MHRKSSINGPYSIAMLNNQTAIQVRRIDNPLIYQISHLQLAAGASILLKVVLSTPVVVGEVTINVAIAR
jgi:hypothetical protein